MNVPTREVPPTFGIVTTESPMYTPDEADVIWPEAPGITTWGDWPEGELQTATHPCGRVALIGQCFGSQNAIEGALSKALAGQSEALTTLPGSYAVVLHEDKQTTVLSSLASRVPVYYSRRDNKTIISSSPLYCAGKSPNLDVDSIAAHLVAAGGGALLENRTVFQDVHELLGGERLSLRPDGNLRRDIYQSLAPRPDTTIQEAAEQIRNALIESVSARREQGLSMSVDYTGGKDSTSLAGLLAREYGSPLPSFFTQKIERSSDIAHARHFAAQNPNIDFRVNRVPEVRGLTYEDIMDVARPDDLGRAMGTLLYAPRDLQKYYSMVAHDTGSRMHLTGMGGAT